MAKSTLLLAIALLVPALGACRAADSAGAGDAGACRIPIEDLAAEIPVPTTVPIESVQLERISTAVPWPRGLEWVDGELVVLARGRHRNAGGIDPTIPDTPGCLYRVDPNTAEVIVPGVAASERVASNGRMLASAVGSPFNLYDTSVAPIEDTLMDRPYCTLVYDDVSRNFFICGYSGVDLPKRVFRKNATDSIHRYDLRDGAWHGVEMHDPDVVPVEELGWVVPNDYYPHHDPTENAAPHGWVNGPNGGCVAGRFLYVVSKDNHLLVQYDMDAIRATPDAGPPESRPVLDQNISLRGLDGTVHPTVALGPSAVAAHDGWLYVGYRSASVVLRFPLEEDGALVQGAPAELIAAFEPWRDETQRSANLIDIAFDSEGSLFVSCAKEARIWKVGKPDPQHPFQGDDSTGLPTTAPPYVDIRTHTGKQKGVGNITFDDQDRLYICAGSYDGADARIAGAIYRASPVGK